MAKKQTETQQPETVEVVVLRDCVFGKCGDIAQLSSADAEQAVAQGMADPHPDALAAAKA